LYRFRLLHEFRDRKDRDGLRSAVILTAIPLETEAVLAHLSDVAIVRGSKGTMYRCGRFLCTAGDWFVVVAITSAGNQGAGSVLQAALADFREIDLVLFVGIAGSVKADVHIGSVVASSQVYNFHSAKADADSLSRPRVVVAEHFLVQAALQVVVEAEWPLRIKAPILLAGSEYPCPLPPAAHIAAIASGEQLVVNVDSESYRIIKQHFNDAAAVEMEGYGMMYAASYMERVPCLVVRGISDACEGKSAVSDAVRQPVAAAHAAAFAFELLSFMAIADALPTASVWTNPLPSGQIPAGLNPEVKQAVVERGRGPEVTTLSSTRSTFVLSLESNGAVLDESRIEAILVSIRELAGDPSITILKVEKGSVRLILDVARSSEKSLLDPSIHRRIEEAQDVKVVVAGPASALHAAQELEAEFKKASAELLHWSSKLPGGEWIDRPEIETLMARFHGEETSTTILLGLPGSGKSALLSFVADRLLNATDGSDPTAVLAIKADSLPSGTDSDAKLQQYLGLSVDPVRAIEQVARWKRVAVIIDQLDALAYQVDLSTGRLNILLNMIRRLSDTPNVHIVASSRTFEFEHDARLRSIDAEGVTLELPAWHSVSAVLRDRGIDADEWSPEARELLRTPQTLRIFLGLLPDQESPHEVLSTYTGMLDRLWHERVLIGPHGPERATLVSDLASAMAEEEMLWLAEARFEDRMGTLNELEASGIVIRSSNGTTVGFSHQTVFEHALARNFARVPGGLSRFVLERQASLFVRPKLWAALSYLRGVDPVAYERELGTMWAFHDLRNHLRRLLVQFLGQQTEPLDIEELLLVPLLSDQLSAFRDEGLAGIAGSPGWFRRLKNGAIQQAMRETKPSGAILAVLSKAWRFAPADVEALIRSHWLHQPDKDFLTWLVLEQCPQWDASILEIAVTVLKRSIIDPFRVDHLARNIIGANPFEAFVLIRTALDRVMDQIDEKRRSEPAVPYPESGTEEEKITWRFEHNPEKPYRNILEHERHYYDLPELVRSQPVAFFGVLWPWYLRLFTALAHEREPLGNGYPGDDPLAIAESRPGHPPPLVAAPIAGVTALAQQSPEEFLRWATENGSVALLAVQALIARGFLSDVDRYAMVAAEFLVADRRRLMIGDFRDRFGITKALISAIVPKLPEEKIKELVAAAQSFKSIPARSREDRPEERRARARIIRKDRLRLLRAFPGNALSDEAKRLAREEERALRNPPDWDSYSTGVQAIGSPMSATAMEKAKDRDILKILDEVDDKTDWKHPRDIMRGGNVQLSREFAEFARRFRERAAEIVRQLSARRHERAAGYAIEAISGATVNNQVIEGAKARPELAFDLLRELVGKGFDNPEFRQSIANAISQLVGRGTEIPEDILAILEKWLESIPTEDEADKENGSKDSNVLRRIATPENESEKVLRHSILWDQRSVMLPHGNYPVLETVTRTFLSRRPAQVSRWLDVLKAHLARNERIEVWEALTRFLHYLGNGDRNDAAEFIERLFSTYPQLLGTTDGALLVARIQSWVGDQYLRSWLERMGAESGPLVRQAYGELAGLIFILRPEAAWFAEVAKTIASSNQDDTVESRVGLAFAAANLWGEADQRDNAVELLVQLIPNANAAIARAALGAFRMVEQLGPDGATVRLLQCLADNSHVIGMAGDSFLAERLETLLPHEAALVSRLAFNLVDQWKDSLGDIRTSIAAITPQLVNLALTLHRLAGAREFGMTLFEKLLEAQAYGAQKALQQIDHPLRVSTGDMISRPLMRRSRRNSR
jgi:nucleoside phosphorylase